MFSGSAEAVPPSSDLTGGDGSGPDTHDTEAANSSPIRRAAESRRARLAWVSRFTGAAGAANTEAGLNEAIASRSSACLSGPRALLSSAAPEKAVEPIPALVMR